MTAGAFSEVLGGSRGINIKPSVGRGGYIRGLAFVNLTLPHASVSLGVGPLGGHSAHAPFVPHLVARCGGRAYALRRGGREPRRPRR